jgi:hypothetical protein
VTDFVKRTDVALAAPIRFPGRYFTSPEIFALETEKIFLQRWLCVGRESQIAGPGDYSSSKWVAKASSSCATGPTVSERSTTSAATAATRLCEEHQGQFAGTIQCPYHAWTYSLDGRLIGAPSADTIEDFDKAEWPLAQRCHRRLGRLPVHQPGRRAGAVRRGVCSPDGTLQPVQSSGPQVAPPNRLRAGLQLEVRGAELFGVLPLSAGAPRAGEAVTAHQRRERSLWRVRFSAATWISWTRARASR